MKQFEEIRALLATQIKQERKRLRSYGTKKFDAFALANAITPFVQALIAEGQWSTVHDFRSWYKQGLVIVSQSSNYRKASRVYRIQVKRRLRNMEQELCEKKDQGLKSAKAKEASRPWKEQSSPVSKTKPTKK